MSIRITGRTGDVTTAMKAKAAAKVDKFSRFYDRITWIDVVLDVEHARNSVDMSAGLNQGQTIVGKAESDDMYKAIDLAIDKITRQLRKHKERQRDHRPRRGGATPPTGGDDGTED
ncbi:MAG: ribosome-associated translation inhibitor RaiA [Planctomycetota bacterium]